MSNSRKRNRRRRGPTAYEARREALPRLEQLYDGALAAIDADERRLGCVHLRDTVSVAVFCVAHPHAGILCLGCALAHAERHEWIFEHTCDQCGNITTTMAAWQRRARLAGLEVHDTRERHGLLVGDLFAVGIGVCADCARGARVPA
jgi:hypothetical protein